MKRNYFLLVASFFIATLSADSLTLGDRKALDAMARNEAERRIVTMRRVMRPELLGFEMQYIVDSERYGYGRRKATVEIEKNGYPIINNGVRYQSYLIFVTDQGESDSEPQCAGEIVVPR